MSVVIGYVHPGQVRAEFMRSVLSTVRDGSTPIEEIIDLASGVNVSRARNYMVVAFLEACTSEWLWVVDSDMAFTSTTLDALIASADPIERPIIGGLYYKINPADPRLDPVPVMAGGPAELPERGCVKVRSTGAACLLVHRSALERIGKVYDGPASWFFESIEDGKYLGEDTTFCRRAYSVDLTVHVNVGVRLGHLKTRMLGTVECP